ncbi:MAG: Ig-like domain-containing protein [Rhodothermales bacterium]
MLRHTSLLLLLLAFTALSCGKKSASTDGMEVETVSLDVPAAAAAFIPTLEGPLRPISVSPSGSLLRLQSDQSIAVTFSRPMVPVGDAPAPAPGQITIEPAVAGALRWEGTQTLVFQPAAPLPVNTAFAATLHAGLVALDGEALAEPYTWTFETPRPRLVSSSPSPYERFVDPSAGLFLTFNQALDPGAAPRSFSLRRQSNDADVEVLFRLEADSIAVVTPAGPLDQGVTYVVSIDAGLAGAQGHLGSAERAEIVFTTYPELAFVQVSQEDEYYNTITTNMDPAQGVTLQFTTEVRFGDLRRALTIQPALDLPAGIEARDDAVSTTHRLPLSWAPETSYTIRVDSLRDVHGQVLATGAHRFVTKAYVPSARIPEGILVVEAAQQPVLPMHVTNVETVSYGLERLAQDQIIPSLPSFDTWHYYDTDAQTVRPAVAATQSRPVATQRNVPTVLPFDLSPALTNGVGVAGVQVLGPARAGQTDRPSFKALAQVTRMGISAKFSPHQNVFFVTDLATAQPVAAAAVTLRGQDNRVYWQGTTDTEGRATGPGWHALGMTHPDEWSTPIQYAFVEKDGDLAFTASLFDDGLEPYRFGIYTDWNPEPLDREGVLFTDRGLYRAGETANFKGIFRQKTDGDWTALRDSLHIEIVSPSDEVVFQQDILPGAMGTFDFTWASLESATLGSYRITATLTDPGRTYVAEHYFRVDAFRRATFSVDVRASSNAYVAGDFFEGTVTGRYLFGAAMQEQPARYYLQRNTTFYAPPGYDGYLFSSWRDRYGADGMIASGDTLLDAEGRLAIRAQLPGNEQGFPARLSLSAAVTDPARQEGGGAAEAILHPALFYVGLKPRTTFLDLSTEQRMTVDLITVDPNGQPVGGAAVDVTLIREQWNSVREVGSDGRMRWRSEHVEEVKQTQTIRSQAGKAQRLAFSIAEGGSYLVRAESRDLRGNAVRTEAYFYATGAGYVAWRRSDDDRIELIPEKTTYAPGETARFMVQSPYETATALVTVEREGILSSQVMTLTGSAPQIAIPITEAHLPNIFVSVMLLTGRTAPPSGASDPGAPSFKIGYAAIDVDTGERRLAVEILPNAETYRPGDEVEVDLRLVDARGNGVQGEVTFSAADAGVLNLIGYALPDPFDTFYGARPLGVTTSQTLANLVKQRNFGLKEMDEGGGGGGDEAQRGVRKDFRPLAHWAPAIQTDERGRARVTFKLPESLTTFRLMATALTAGNQFGNAQKDVVVTKPLVLTPALPRFARLGDRFEAGVLVTNTTGADGPVAVSVEAQGLSLAGETSKTVQMARGETQEVRFDWNGDAAGEATLRFSARLGAEQDAFEIGLPVQQPTIKATQATFASTDDAADEALRLPAGLIPSLGGFQARVASTALVGLEGAAEYLFEYPYGCLEQRTSRIRPLIAGTELLDLFQVDVLGGQRDALIGDWIQSLPAFWTGSGFTLWRGGSYVHPYVSAYVVLALAEARDAGFRIPEALTADAVEALASAVSNGSQRPEYYSEAVWNDTRALMLYALGRHNRFLDQEINDLATRVTAGNAPISMDGRSHLLRLLVRRNAPLFARQKQALTESLVAALRVESTTAYLTASASPATGWIFASDTRSTAFGLAALIETRPPAETQVLIERMVRYLLETRRGDHWASTQENAAVIDAFRLYREAYEDVSPDFTAKITLAGRSILEAAFQGRSLDTEDAVAALTGLPAGETLPVRIEKSGDGRLYYTLRLETYSTEPADALAQGLSVERRIQRLDESGQPVGAIEVTGGKTVTLDAGELVRVTLRLTSPADRNYVVLDDALPAGLEALNDAFITTNSQLTQDTGSDRWWGSFNHTEIRDDRVVLFADYLTRGEHTYTYVARATTPGTFSHPPAQSELMYQPEINGRTASGSLVVR